MHACVHCTSGLPVVMDTSDASIDVGSKVLLSLFEKFHDKWLVAKPPRGSNPDDDHDSHTGGAITLSMLGTPQY